TVAVDGDGGTRRRVGQVAERPGDAGRRVRATDQLNRLTVGAVECAARSERHAVTNGHVVGRNDDLIVGRTRHGRTGVDIRGKARVVLENQIAGREDARVAAGWNWIDRSYRVALGAGIERAADGDRSVDRAGAAQYGAGRAAIDGHGAIHRTGDRDLATADRDGHSHRPAQSERAGTRIGQAGQCAG